MISLTELADVWAPPPVGLWPISTTGWVLLGFVVALLVYWLWRYLGYRQANQYRRQALHELRQAQTNEDLALILKRTALVAYPREQVASLNSEHWCDWLAQYLKMPDDARSALLNAFYRPDSAVVSDALRSYCERWIQKHQGKKSC